MALKDVKNYLYTMQCQYLEMKEDLADFEQGLKDGYITEEKLTTIKEEFALVEANYQRLLYIDYLFSLPNRPKKKAKYKKANAFVETALDELNASLTKVETENKDIIITFKQHLKGLQQELVKK